METPNAVLTSPSHSGHSSKKAAQLLQKFGPNEIRRPKTRPIWRLIVDQFKSPLVVILVFACVLSAALGEAAEAAAIGLILILNALIGFFQEYRAENAIMALQQMTAPRAKVVRDGHQATILAKDVVPGDTLLLEAGDIVAADAEIHEASRFQVNEAVLTGESMPSSKHAFTARDHGQELGGRFGQVFMGTAVVTGTACVTVSATGMKTELGKIASLIATAESGPTPLQVQLEQVGKSLLFLCLGVVGLVVAIGIWKGQSWLELVIFSVSLAVAAVPEGMPAIVTVALALGVQRLAAHKALIRKLPSIETLGSVSVICTDKTGTLTTGHMRVREVWGESQAGLLLAAASCCDAQLDEGEVSGTGDPTELAILFAALEQSIRKEAIENGNPCVATEPFDAERRRMSILRRDGVNYVKGAVESVMPLCKSSTVSAEAEHAAATMSAQGLRVLAVAVGQGEGERELKLLGFLGIADPPRPEVIAAIEEAHRAGITIIMITGDHPNTAAAIARELGLVRDGDSLPALVHARATPEDKLKLVRKWKEKGHIVAMTGDGVNDAPALREAHIGIAMGKTGTEVTRQAADLILADDNFATIITAVREGRSIFQNIRRAISYLLVGNFAEIAVVLAAMILGLPVPLLAAHLLWINLVTDALPALTLIAEPVESGIMQKPPRSPGEPLLGQPEWIQIVWTGLLEAAVIFGLYWYLLQQHTSEYARNLVFTTFVFSQLLRSFGARSNTKVLWEVGPLRNLWQLGVVLVTASLQLSLHYIPISQKMFALKPLSVDDLLFALPFSLVAIAVIEIVKVARRISKP